MGMDEAGQGCECLGLIEWVASCEGDIGKGV